MRTTAMMIVAVLSVVALGQSNGTAAVRVTGGSGRTTQELTVSLSVAKAGKKEIVTPPPAPGATQVSGTHTFPVGSSANAVSTYYRGLLTNAGWTEGTDFTAGSDSISFYEITKLDCKEDGQIKIAISTDQKSVAYAADPPANRIRFERPVDTGQDGLVTILAFGIKWDEVAKKVSSRLCQVTVQFAASDSDAVVMERILESMIEQGWSATSGAGGITITSSGDGAKVYSIWMSPDYSADGTNKDKWTIEEVRQAR